MKKFFRLQICVSQSFKFFCAGDNRLLSEFLRKWGWFHEHSPKYLAWKLQFQKTETQFFRWKGNDYNNIDIFLSLENPCTFLLAKEKTWKTIFNTNSELLQNRTERINVLFKTIVNWLFNGYMTLFSHCLFWLKNWHFSINSCKSLLFP